MAGKDEECTITNMPRGYPLVVLAFDVYPGYSTSTCTYHYLTVNSVQYCGTGEGPNGVIPDDGEMRWTASDSQFASTRSGWEICFQVWHIMPMWHIRRIYIILYFMHCRVGFMANQLCQSSYPVCTHVALGCAGIVPTRTTRTNARAHST